MLQCVHPILTTMPTIPIKFVSEYVQLGSMLLIWLPEYALTSAMLGLHSGMKLLTDVWMTVLSLTSQTTQHISVC